jgi:hypothetical protein
MSPERNPTMTEKATHANRPTHRAYYVTGEGDARRWHELGPLWAHKDGSGFTFLPNVLPAPGQAIVIRMIKQEALEAEPNRESV